MPNLHPLLVHFPVALTIVSVAFDFAWLFTQRQDLRRVADWNLAAAAVCAVFAALSGLLATGAAPKKADVLAAVSRHETLAFTALTAILSLLFARYKFRRDMASRTRTLLLTGGVVVSLAVIAAAWTGGDLVYRHAVGVALPHVSVLRR